MIILEEMARRTAPEPKPADKSSGNTFLVVARGHQELLDQLKTVVGDVGWVRVIEDRRDDPTILPRQGREGTVYVDQEIKP